MSAGVAGDYFQAMGIPLRAGRWPTPRDLWEDPTAVIVNEALARQIFPGENALGKRVRTGGTGPWLVETLLPHVADDADDLVPKRTSDAVGAHVKAAVSIRDQQPKSRWFPMSGLKRTMSGSRLARR